MENEISDVMVQVRIFFEPELNF